MLPKVGIFSFHISDVAHWTGPRQACAEDALHVRAGVEKPWGSAEPWVSCSSLSSSLTVQTTPHMLCYASDFFLVKNVFKNFV